MRINNKNPRLTEAQISLLQVCAKGHFTFGGFTSIDDILTQLKVEVVIESGIESMTMPSCIEEAAKYWEKEYHRLSEEYQEKRNKNDESNESIRKALNEAEKNLGRANREKNLISSIPVRGLYFPKEKVIKLYPDEMVQEYGGAKMDELLVSTLAHETMHAYFNRPRHNKYPYVYFVEEPLAEFGMLLYLQATKSSYYQWAYNDVRKQVTCYKFGADLMEKYLSEGTNSPTRKYLEAYKILIDIYAMPLDPNTGDYTLPRKSRSPISINGHHITSKWQDIFAAPPRYFYDATTRTLGLDGCWDTERRHLQHEKDIIMIHIIFRVNHIDNIYLGDSFYFDYNHDIKKLISTIPVTVSRKNGTYIADKGILIYKDKPVLSSCGQGYYKLCRNGKWGVIDSQLNLIIPIVYDYIWRIDQNELFMVENNNLLGLVNTKGVEQVEVKYEDMTENDNGTYTVELNGEKFIIDKNGIRK